MADLTANSTPAASVHKTDEAHRRLRVVDTTPNGDSRWPGQLAILLATLALVSLLWTVFGKRTRQHS